MTLTNSTPLIERAQNEDVTDDDIDPAAQAADLHARAEAGHPRRLGRGDRPRGQGRLPPPGGIYSSHITEWRRARDAGSLAALDGKPKGARSADRREADRLRKKNERLEAELEKTRTALDIVGKVHARLEGISKSADTEEK